jgi:hypothetical protein
MDKDVRRLAVSALALIVFLFVGRAVIGSVFDDEAERRKAVLARSGLSGAGAKRPDSGEVGRMRTLRASLHDALEDLVPELAYERPPEFDVPAGRSADLLYLEVLRREQDALVQMARFRGKSVPLDLGMPVPNPTGTEDVLAALRALHVVHVVVTAALDADCSVIDKIEMIAATRRRRDTSLVRTHGVQFDLRGSAGAVQAMLAAVVGGTPYLALDDVRIEALDEDGESLRCRMIVSAVSLDREALEELEVLP